MSESIENVGIRFNKVYDPPVTLEQQLENDKALLIAIENLPDEFLELGFRDQIKMWLLVRAIICKKIEITETKKAASNVVSVAISRAQQDSFVETVRFIEAVEKAQLEKGKGDALEDALEEMSRKGEYEVEHREEETELSEEPPAPKKRGRPKSK
jgi:hypothetical protein